KVRRGLSAGRVQSVALKMITDREDEIKAFVPEEYWTFAAKLAGDTPPPFVAKLTKVEGKKADVTNEEQARKIEAALKSGSFTVADVARKEKRQSAAPPFITSTLQRAADIANGPYTLRASGEVLKFAGFLAVFGEVAADDEDDEKHDDKALPPLSAGDVVRLLDLDTKQNFTQPPPRFTEATLVKALEENGIGRPSTYGQILTTIQARDYTYKHDGKFLPTHLGTLVITLLKQSFGDIIDEGYTAR